MNEQTIKQIQAIGGLVFTSFIFLPFLLLYVFSEKISDLNTILSILIACIILILHILFLIQTLLHDRKEYYLTYGLLIGIFASLTAGMNKINLFPEIFSNPTVPLVLSLILWCFMYLLIYLFFESLFGVEINNKRLIIIFFFFFLAILSYIAIVFVPNESSLFWNYADLGYDSLGIIIFSFGTWVLYNSYKQVGGETAQILQITGLSFILLGFVIGLIMDFSFIIEDTLKFNPQQFLDTSYGDLLKVIGIIIFTVTYIREIDYIYRLPFPIYTIIFFKSDSGLSLNITNIKNVSNEKTIKLDENLITGTVTAIMTLLKEGLGSEGYLKSINSTDQTIVVKSNKFVSIAVLTIRPTKVLQNSIEKALEEFTAQYKEKLHSDKAIEISEFNDTKNLLKKAFPYLIL